MSLALALILLQAATVAPPAPPKLHGVLFIAPSGEPFRAAKGEPYPVAGWFARADADHDGRLTRGEFRRDFITFFARLDSNGDGIVDAKEITFYETDIVPEVRVGFGSGPEFRSIGAAPGGEGGDEQKSRNLPDLPRGGGRYALINAPQPVVATDADLNRRITPQEYAAAADRRFTLLDPTERGYLTLATLPKTPVQQRGEGLFRRGR